MNPKIKSLTISLLIGFAFAGGITYAAAVWQGTGWIANGEVITASKIKGNFEYLYERIVGEVATTIKFSNDLSTCNAIKAGTIRWTGNAFEGCDGSNWISFLDKTTTVEAPQGCGSEVKRVFTSSGTWTKPACALSVVIQCWGGGGGGGGSSWAARTAAAGGGGGGYSRAALATNALPSTVVVTVGNGGAGGIGMMSGGSSGGNGSLSKFGTYISPAYGGKGGASATGFLYNVSILGGAGGLGTIPGSKGGNGITGSGVDGLATGGSAGGHGTIVGSGTGGILGVDDGGAGSTYGGGGAGGKTVSDGYRYYNGKGGAGASGACIVTAL